MEGFLVAASSQRGGTRTREWMTEGPKYCTRSVVGGNIVTIGFDHMIDFVMLVLGELSEFADHIMLQGTLNSGAPLSVTFRRGPPFMGTPGFIWSIHGERGEIRIMAAGPVLQADDDETNITVHSFDQEDLEVIEWDWHSKDLARPARNVAPMYEAFASQGTENYPDFSHAVLRHRLIEEVYKSA